MSDAIIRRAFETRLKAWADALTPPLPIAFENAPFVAPAITSATGRYARAFVLPGETASQDLEGKHREYVGVLQVSFVMPINRGANEADQLFDSLSTVFTPGPPLVQNGLDVFLTRPFTKSPAINEPDRYVIPASTAYKADLFLP